MSIQDLLAEINALSVEERVNLIEQVWRGVESGIGAPAFAPSPEQVKELERRIAEDDANPDDVLDWEDVKSEIEAELEQCRGKSSSEKQPAST